MLPTFNQLHHFCVLAEVGHMGRAAARLNISQPPLTRQIAALETMLGVTLFNRVAKGVTLTAAGHQFFNDATAILSLMQQAVKNSQDIAFGLKGIIKLGATMYASYNVVPPIARKYKNAHPEVELLLQEMVPNDLNKNILGGTLDAAFNFAGHDLPGISSLTITTEPLVAVLQHNHLLRDEPVIDLRDLADDPFVLVQREMAPLLYDRIMAGCQQAQFSPKIGMEACLQQTVVNFVAEGFGVALVPQSMQRAPVKGLIYKALRNPPTIDLVLQWSTENSHPCLANFIQLCRQLTEDAVN